MPLDSDLLTCIERLLSASQFLIVRSFNPHNDSVMEVTFIPTWPQRKQELREAKLAAELPKTSENTEAAFLLLQEREDGSVFEEPKKNWLCPTCKTFIQPRMWPYLET